MRDSGRVVGRHQYRVGSSGVDERLAQPTRRQDAVAQIGFVHEQEIDIASERQMLKSIVQQVNGGTELALRQIATLKAVRADEYGHTG
jgi:hypothetical protein